MFSQTICILILKMIYSDISFTLYEYSHVNYEEFSLSILILIFAILNYCSYIPSQIKSFPRLKNIYYFTLNLMAPSPLWSCHLGFCSLDFLPNSHRFTGLYLVLLSFQLLFYGSAHYFNLFLKESKSAHCSIPILLANHHYFPVVSLPSLVLLWMFLFPSFGPGCQFVLSRTH